MNKCPTAIKGTAGPACANGGYAKCGQMREKVSDRPGQYTAHSQETRELPFSTSHVTSGSHQRRWSADFSRCGTSNTITVKKNKKEPQPPQRSISLLRPHKASNSSTNRNSCPPIGVFRSPIHPSSSSTSSSSTCSCSSPPPVPTSLITGHDPLGWKLHPKSSSTSPRARNNRLSLQIPLPVIFPEPMRCPSTNSQLDYSPIPEHSAKIINPRPKPSRRHSDSSAFLRSLATRPVVTLEELRAVHLYPLTLSDESDEVFGLGKEDEVKATARPRKIPPPIPEKTPKTRQIAQVIAQSHCRPYTVETKEEVIYTSVIKPKPKDSRQTEDQGCLHGRKSGNTLQYTSCQQQPCILHSR